MPNKLIKDPMVSGAGSGGGSGGSGSSGGGGVGGGAVVSPTPGSACFNSIFTRIVELWPPYAYTHTHIEAGNYFLVASLDGQYVYRVTGVCSGGYVQLNYEATQTPGVGNG